MTKLSVPAHHRDLPRTLSHRFHRRREMKLAPEDGVKFQCDGCRLPGRGLRYQCGAARAATSTSTSAARWRLPAREIGGSRFVLRDKPPPPAGRRHCDACGRRPRARVRLPLPRARPRRPPLLRGPAGPLRGGRPHLRAAHEEAAAPSARTTTARAGARAASTGPTAATSATAAGRCSCTWRAPGTRCSIVDDRLNIFLAIDDRRPLGDITNTLNHYESNILRANWNHAPESII